LVPQLMSQEHRSSYCAGGYGPSPSFGTMFLHVFLSVVVAQKSSPGSCTLAAYWSLHEPPCAGGVVVIAFAVVVTAKAAEVSMPVLFPLLLSGGGGGGACGMRAVLPRPSQASSRSSASNEARAGSPRLPACANPGRPAVAILRSQRGPRLMALRSLP